MNIDPRGPFAAGIVRVRIVPISGRRTRLIAQSRLAASTKPAQAASASTTKSLSSRVPSWYPVLQKFEQADQDEGNRRRHPSVVAVGHTECQSDQDKGEGVFAVLTEIGGVRSICRRTECCEGHRSGQNPGNRSKNEIHRARIARRRAGCRSHGLEMAVWLMRDSPDYDELSIVSRSTRCLHVNRRPKCYRIIAVPARPCRA